VCPCFSIGSKIEASIRSERTLCVIVDKPSPIFFDSLNIGMISIGIETGFLVGKESLPSSRDPVPLVVFGKGTSSTHKPCAAFCRIAFLMCW
jgi:hypothetical protein